MSTDEHRKHIESRQRLKSIALVEDFESLLSRVVLSEEDKQMLRLIYIEGNTYIITAEKLGLSEQAVKKRHKKALSKIAAAF